MTDQEREKLQTFLGELYNLLKQALYEQPDWFPEELRQPMHEAWMEVQPKFDDVRAAISHGGHDEAIETAGLTGASLELKLKGWQRYLRLFYDNPIVATCRRALRWANVLTASLATAIPAAEPIKEFKETSEQALEG